tara:strand:- start:1413 stop:1556 length:144 start_codon:yes stop_codon:yes gene_type:complete
MTDQTDIDYIYQDTNAANFQLVVEDIVNALVNLNNQQNSEVVAWFLN